MEIPERKHHINGPSRLSLRAACPGSYQADIDTPIVECESGEAAEAGRLRHDVGANGLSVPDTRDAELGRLDTEEDKVLVRRWWEFCEEKYKELRAAYPAEKIISLIEHKTTTFDGRICTPDFALIVPGKMAVVADLKRGQPERARWNLQLADYAGAVRAKYPDIENVTVAIVHAFGVDVWSYQHGELDDRIRTIKRILTDCTTEGAERRPGKHCDYCRARHNCNARNALVAEVRALRDPVATVRALDGIARREMYEKLKIAVDRLGDIITQINNAVLDGSLDVPGYGVGKGRSSRLWKDPNSALIELTGLAAAAGIDPEGLTELISVSKAEKILGSKKKIEHLIESRDGKPTVVKDRTN